MQSIFIYIQIKPQLKYNYTKLKFENISKREIY